MATIKVVCGIIFKDDLIFICRRNANKHLGGYWEFPGGKVEIGETQEDCLNRELDEEIGMKIEIVKEFKSVVHKYENYSIELISYICRFLEADFEMTDHDSFEWIKLIELKNKNLAPADVIIASELLIIGRD